MDWSDVVTAIRILLKSKQVVTGAGHLGRMLELQDLDDDLDDLVKEYTKNKGDKRRSDDILAKVIQIQAALLRMTFPNFSRMPTRVSQSYNLFTFAEATRAREVLLKLYQLQIDGKLPSPGMPWPRRRSIYANMRDGMTKYAFQIEAQMRRDNAAISEAQDAEDAVTRAAHDPNITQEEIVMLGQDWKDWIKVEQDASERRNFLQTLDQSIGRVITNYSSIIDAGDKVYYGR
jgi:hypothetical protein